MENCSLTVGLILKNAIGTGEAVRAKEVAVSGDNDASDGATQGFDNDPKAGRKLKSSRYRYQTVIGDANVDWQRS